MSRFSIGSLAALFCLSLLAFAPTAFAVDGVTLINQATATNGLAGCPHAGFPIIICKSGSYRLSGNLISSNASVDIVDIAANDVELDLNGFTITGPIICQAGTYPVVCSDRSAGSAIGTPSLSTGLYAVNVTVRNGTVRGMGNGIALAGSGALVDGVHAVSNAGPGITVVSGVVIHCTAEANQLTGITGFATVISFSTARYNGAYGFQGVVSEDYNTLKVTGGTVVSNCVASNNGQDGIFDAFLAVNNTSTYNIGLGLRYDGNGYGYMGNVIYGNSGGTVSPLGTSLGHNLCNSVAC